MLLLFLPEILSFALFALQSSEFTFALVHFCILQCILCGASFVGALASAEVALLQVYPELIVWQNLIATFIAVRALDLEGVDHIFNKSMRFFKGHRLLGALEGASGLIGNQFYASFSANHEYR